MVSISEWFQHGFVAGLQLLALRGGTNALRTLFQLYYMTFFIGKSFPIKIHSSGHHD